MEYHGSTFPLTATVLLYNLSLSFHGTYVSFAAKVVHYSTTLLFKLTKSSNLNVDRPEVNWQQTTCGRAKKHTPVIGFTARYHGRTWLLVSAIAPHYSALDQPIQRLTKVIPVSETEAFDGFVAGRQSEAGLRYAGGAGTSEKCQDLRSVR